MTYNPNQSVEALKYNIADDRYEKIITILREKRIYRNITLPDFIYINNRWNALEIEYPSYGEGKGRLALIDNDNNHYHPIHDNWFEDDEFIKIVHKLDELIDEDIDDYIDEFYYDVDDQRRIDYIKENTKN